MPCNKTRKHIRGKAKRVRSGVSKLGSVQTTKKFSPGSDNNLSSSVFER